MVILFDAYNMPDSIYDIVFSTDQQAKVARLLVSYMQKNGGEIGKTEMGLFAQKLHDGEIIVKSAGKRMFDNEKSMSYNKRQFYDRILTPMKGLGLIDYDMYKKTYRVSQRFNQVMVKVGLLWLRETGKNK